jgi:hypothetical protein
MYIETRRTSAFWFQAKRFRLEVRPYTSTEADVCLYRGIGKYLDGEGAWASASIEA